MFFFDLFDLAISHFEVHALIFNIIRQRGMKTWPMILYVLISSSLRALSSSESGSSSSEGFSDVSYSDGVHLIPLFIISLAPARNKTHYQFLFIVKLLGRLLRLFLPRLRQILPFSEFSVRPGTHGGGCDRRPEVYFTLSAACGEAPEFSKEAPHLPNNGAYDPNGKMGQLRNQLLYFD
jgi:hypothetical protein